MPARNRKKKAKTEVKPTAAPVRRPSRGVLLWSVAAFLLPLTLYSFTFCRWPYWGDSTELALVARSAGVAHPTGYPLWSLSASLFARLPLPGWQPALAVNLLSALFGAAACLALYALLRRLDAARPAALLGALALALATEMWLQCSVAEVYSLHALLLALVLLAAVRAHQRPGAANLCLLALVFGLALCNHMTSVLLIPPVALLLLAGVRRHGPSGQAAWWKAGGCLLLGLLPYLYLPLSSLADRWPDYGNPETWEGFRWLVTGSQFRYLMFSSGADYAVGELVTFLAGLPRQFSPWLLALALPGAIWSWSEARQRVCAASFTLYAALVTFHAVNYHIDDKAAYYLPVYLVLSLWIGFGGGWVTRGAGRLISRRAIVVVGGLLALLLVYQGVSAFPVADRRTDRSLDLYTAAVIRSAEPGALLIVGDFNVYSAYLYGSLVRGEYRQYDCVLDYLFPFPWYLEQLPRVSPGVVVPQAALDVARNDWNREGGHIHGLEHGRRKEQVLIEVKRLIIEANLPRRPVYLHMRDDTTMKESWAGIYPLEYRGLSYRVTTSARPPRTTPYAADYPFFHGRRHPYQLAAAHKFSDAANRLGVIFASAGRVNEAFSTFNLALKHDPENFGIHRNRGLLRLELLGDPAGARDDFAAYLAGWEKSGEEQNREIMAIRDFLGRQPPPTGDDGR